MANTKSIDLELSSSQFLSITDASQTGLDLTGDCSFMGWFNVEQLPSTAGSNFRMISKNDNGANQRGYQLLLTTTDKMQFLYYDTVTGTNLTLKTTDSAVISGGDVGNWVHFAVTIDVSTPAVTFYIDGSSVASTFSSSAATSIANNSNRFQIGAIDASGSPLQFFDGKMDEMGVYNATLSGATVSSDYNSGNGTERGSGESNIVAGWRYEDDLLDVTSNNNDLTNNNSATYSTDVPFSGGTAYTLIVDTMSIIATFNAVIFSRLYNLVVDTMSVLATFNPVTFVLSRAYTLAVDTMSIVADFKDVVLRFSGWTNKSQNSTSWSEDSQNSTSWTEETRN